jgi:predicted GNAT family N-acyltransferase
MKKTNKDYKVQFFFNQDLSLMNLFKVIKLKKQFWKHGYVSQIKWIQSNISNRDIHCMMFESSKLIGYNCIVQDEILVSGISTSCHIISNVITDKNSRGKGVAKRILEDSISHVGVDEVIILFCKTHLVGFYEKFGFKTYLSNQKKLSPKSILMVRNIDVSMDIFLNKIV